MTEAEAAHAVEVCESLLRKASTGDLGALGGKLQGSMTPTPSRRPGMGADADPKPACAACGLR